MVFSGFGVVVWWVLTVMWVCWVGGGLVCVFAGKIAEFCGILLGGIARLKGFGVEFGGFGLCGLREIWVAWGCWWRLR